MSDQCDQIRNQIFALKREISSLQAELRIESGDLKQTLTFLIKKAQAELAEKKKELKECESQINARLSNPKVFGFEVTQGLLEYELVAGKDTLVRVFVGAKQPVVLPIASTKSNTKKRSLQKQQHFDVPPYGSSRLDFAVLRVSGPDGLSFEVPGQMSGLFTNMVKSYSEADNVNFYTPGNLLYRVGSYHFVAHFYRDGAIVGTNDLGTHKFKGTKDLRLLIVVNTYPMPVEAWSTVFKALGYLQRNLPVRAGIAPLDSDLSVGLRYLVDPFPFDTGWPEWKPVERRFTEFNDQQARNKKPDRADKILIVRTQQPSEGALGGVARQGGPIAAAIINRPPNDRYYATVVSQEIGHTLNLVHTINPTISTSSAFDLLNRKSLSSVQSIMYNPVGNNEICFFTPEDWRKTRRELLKLDSTGPD